MESLPVEPTPVTRRVPVPLAYRQQVYAMARLRAAIDHVVFTTASPDVRAAYLEAAAVFLEPMKGLSL